MGTTDDRRYRGEFYRAVDQRQGIDLRQEQYYVPIYDDPAFKRSDVVAKLLDVIEFTTGESIQVLSGYRGSGKTSELLRLRNQLRAAGYVVVYMDIEDYFNPEVGPPSNAFLFALAAGFAHGCEELGAPGEPAMAVWRKFAGWLSRLEVSPTVTLGPVELGASLREDESFRAQVDKYIKDNRREFLAEFRGYVREAARAVAGAGRVVFLVDSIDHFRGRSTNFHAVREAVEIVFTEGAESLALPGIHVVYTVPVFVNTALGTLRDVLNIKIAEPDGTVVRAGVDALSEVLRRRAPGNDIERLLDPGLLERLVGVSGGLFRDLLRLTGEVILGAEDLPADAAAVGRAEALVRSNLLMPLTMEQVEVLKRIDASHGLEARAEEWADVADLMARGAILSYPNGERSWFAVHPLIRSHITETSGTPERP